jgi:hypothetical protein
MPYNVEHALPDNDGVVSLLTEHDRQTRLCQVARYNQQYDSKRYSEAKWYIAIEERCVF